MTTPQQAIERLTELAEAEEAILEALNASMKRSDAMFGRYSAAWEITAARASALRHAILTNQGEKA